MLDIRNPFNTAGWEIIVESSTTRAFFPYLAKMLSNYLHNRSLLYNTDDGIKEYRITTGIPQGSS